MEILSVARCSSIVEVLVEQKLPSAVALQESSESREREEDRRRDYGRRRNDSKDKNCLSFLSVLNSLELNQNAQNLWTFCCVEMSL